MKKLLMLFLAFAITLSAEYSVGDIAADDSWEDSDGGPLVSQSLQNLVDEQKVIIMTWGYDG